MATASTGPPEATAPATGSSSAELDPSVSPPPESLLPNTPVYEIASTPFRGKAFLAIKPLQPGDLILIESPLFVLPPHSPPRSGRSETEPGLSSILAALSQCTTEEREAYMALSNSFKGRRAMQRWIDGGLLEGREGDEEALKVVGIWVTNRQGAFIHDVSAVWRTFSVSWATGSGGAARQEETSPRAVAEPRYRALADTRHCYHITACQPLLPAQLPLHLRQLLNPQPSHPPRRRSHLPRRRTHNLLHRHSQPQLHPHAPTRRELRFSLHLPHLPTPPSPARRERRQSQAIEGVS